MESIKPIDILIAGVQKSATSSLKFYLQQHPCIITHPLGEFTYFFNEEEYARGYEVAYHKYFKVNDPGKLRLAKNVDVIFSEQSIIRLKKHNKDAKIIVILRHPADRAYSAYWFALQRGWENIKSFEKALEAGTSRFNDYLSKNMCAYYERGEYLKQIQTLYKHFDPSQVHIVLYEDVAQNTQFVLKNILRFCALDTAFDFSIAKKYNESAQALSPLLSKYIIKKNPLKTIAKAIIPKNSYRAIKMKLKAFNSTKFVPPPMNSETRKRLIKYYADMNTELSSLIRQDLAHWNE